MPRSPHPRLIIKRERICQISASEKGEGNVLKDLVLKNRSYRGYDPSVPVPEDTLRDLVDLARFTASGANLQPLKYRLVFLPEEVAGLNALTRWAKALPHVALPREGRFPPAYIVICNDLTICRAPEAAKMDVAIAAQTILLGAVERGLGGIMLGNFDHDRLREAVALPEGMEPMLILAIGKPNDKIVLTEAEGSTAYYRDENDVHYVPKRRLEDILI